eukprot:TRINITY_DN26057_c0_g5_i2.p2 TRINITY_DN26057_c0_g5~~TRINITY_DN26057_c0_g5_i2.p2  ORF type:complete len:306 (+),score=63.49 TRINITY_DN26057_c0_g5_i2:1346-2263(+)
MGELWYATVQPNRPDRFNGKGVLELHSAVLKSDAATAATLYFAAKKGGPKLALGTLTREEPNCQLRARLLGAGATLSCSSTGGDAEVLIVGRRRPRRSPAFCVGGVRGSESALPMPPAKRARTEVQSSVNGARGADGTAKVLRPGSPRGPAASSAPGASQAPVDPPTPLDPAEKRRAKRAAKAAREAAARAEAATIVKRRLASGVEYEILGAGRGALARPGRIVKVLCEGRVVGAQQLFEKGAKQFRLGLGETLPGLDAGVKGMQQGERRRLHIPDRLGFGSAEGRPRGVPKRAALVYEVELLEC